MATFTEVFTSPSPSGAGLHARPPFCKLASGPNSRNASLSTEVPRRCLGSAAAGAGSRGVGFTSLVSPEPAMYCSALEMVVLRMSESASCVRKALWGVMRTFGKERSRENCWSHFSRRLLSSILSKSLKKRPASFS